MDEDAGKKEILIRAACKDDVPALAELAEQLGYPTAPGEIAEWMEYLMWLEDHEVFVAEVPAVGVVGWVHVFASYRLIIAPSAEVGGLVVRDGWREQGVGRLLLEKAEGWALDNGLTRMRVNSNTLRQGVPGFYEHLGYERIKIQNVFNKSIG